MDILTIFKSVKSQKGWRGGQRKEVYGLTTQEKRKEIRGGRRSWRREENCQDNLNLMFNCRIYGSAEIETVSQIYTELENGLEKLEKLGTIERGHSKEYKEIED